jgi:formate dehydrogenase major subunit
VATLHDRIPLLARVARHAGVMPDKTYSRESRGMRARIEGAQQTISVCPYCAVGCSQIIYHRDGKLLDIEGNPDSPINAGTLCPKGAATYQLSVNPLRLTRVKYRAPYSDHWEEKPLDWAMERIAQLVKEARDATFEEKDAEGRTVNRTLAIAHLGGATLDNEENYLIKKLFSGLGMVWIENQARI